MLHFSQVNISFSDAQAHQKGSGLCVHICTRRPEADVGCQLFTMYFEVVSCHLRDWLAGCQWALGTCPSLQVFSAGTLCVRHYTQLFTWVLGTQLQSHACLASTLLTELLAQLRVFLSIFWIRFRIKDCVFCPTIVYCMFMTVLLAWTYVYHAWWPGRSGEGMWSPAIGLTDGFENALQD